MKMFSLYFTLTIIILLSFSLSWAVESASIVENKWQETISRDLAVLKEKPNDIRLRFRLAVAYANLGDLEAATKEFDALKSLDGGKITQKVVSEYESLNKVNTEDLLVMNYLAFAYFAAENYTSSRAIFEKIIKLDPESIWSYNYLAIVQGNMNDFNAALKSLDKANSIKENKYTHFIYSLIYYKKGQILKAMWHLCKSGNVGLQLLKQ